LLTGTKSGFWVNTAALKFATLSGMGATPELSDRLCAELFKPLYRQKSLNGAALSCV
jgi:hypothetical protein